MTSKQEEIVNKEDVWIHTCCDMCLGGCGTLVHRVNGVVVDIKGDPDNPASRGKLCSKGYAAIMTLYDPNRVKTPMKRANPEKGIGVDPKWVPISWDEALNILQEKLTAVRKDDPRKLVMCHFAIMGDFDMYGFWGRAFGTPHTIFCGYYCGNYLHSAMYQTNGTFHCDFDPEYCQYLMLFGNQAGFGVGLHPNITSQKVAEARKRGMKVVAVDPIANHAASKADEWLPIRPGTDAALAMSMINVLINELGIFDREFIKKYTNGPYLVKPDGYYIRHDGKPLVWDTEEKKAKPYDAEVKDCALEGSYTVDGIECKPAFELLKAHAKKYSPEMAAEITTIPAATIRRISKEFGTAARIGSTITIDGKEFPYRPVTANLYRGAGAHKHGVAAALSTQMLNLVVGAFYLPGSHRGTHLIGPKWKWEPGQVDGMITPPQLRKDAPKRANFYNFEVNQPENFMLPSLFPLSTETAPLGVLTSLDPDAYKLPYKPEVMIACRRNIFKSGVDYDLTTKALKKYKFMALFAIHLDEMADFADLVLPEQTFLEKLELMPRKTAWGEAMNSWHHYWGIRQPVVPPVGEARDWMEVLMELADRMGFVGDVYKLFNERQAQNYLKGQYKLDPKAKYSNEEIVDRSYKSEFGEDKGLEWFKKNGNLSFKRELDEMFPLPWLKVRFPIYFENRLVAGKKILEATQKFGIKDWDVSDYEPLPDWKPCDAYNEKGEYDLYASNFRVPTHAQTYTAENAWLSEVAQLNPYSQKVLINTQAAKKREIKDKDKICVESAVGKVTGEAKVTECIHPEVIGISSHFGTLAKNMPVAYGKGANFNRLLPLSIDPISGGVDACVKVKVYKV